MGLFDGLRGSPQKTETQGDAALAAGDPLQAYRKFREAQRQVGRKDPALADRLQQKAGEAKKAFVHLKIAEARDLLADEVADAATEALTIARDYLEPDQATLAQEIADLLAQAEALQDKPRAGRIMATGAAGGLDPTLSAPGPAPAGDTAGDTVLGGSPVVFVVDEEQAAEDLEESPQADIEVLFEQYAGVLSPEDARRGAELGPAFQTGFVAYQRGDRDSALAALQSAAREHPHEPLVLETLALVLDETGHHAEARAHYQEALAQAPQRPNARLALAAILAGTREDLGPDPQGAFDLLEEGVRVDGANAAQYLLSAAEVALIHQRPAEALARTERAMQAGAEQNPVTWQLHAAALEASGALDEAEEAYTRAVRLGGNSLLPRAHFAEFALRHNRALKAAEETIYQTCLGCQGSLPTADELDYYGFLLSRIQFARGDYKHAIDGLEHLLAKNPPDPLAQTLREMRRAAQEALRARREAGAVEAEDEDQPADAD